MTEFAGSLIRSRAKLVASAASWATRSPSRTAARSPPSPATTVTASIARSPSFFAL